MLYSSECPPRFAAGGSPIDHRTAYTDYRARWITNGIAADPSAKLHSLQRGNCRLSGCWAHTPEGSDRQRAGPCMTIGPRMTTWRDDPARVRPMLAPTIVRAAARRSGAALRAEVRWHPGAGSIAGPSAAQPRRHAFTIWSRNGNDKTPQFPELVRGLEDVRQRRSTRRSSSTGRSSR